MKSIIVMRVDGNSLIGLGHIMRCISLACILKNCFDLVFYSTDPEEEVISKSIKQGGFNCVPITNESQFLSSLKGSETVVLDGYHFNSEYQKTIKDKNCKLVCIDDLHDKHFHSDIVVNHAPGIDKAAYSAEHDTEFLLGPEYAMLRPSFIEQAVKNRRVDSIKHVLINFGGSDSKNLSYMVLQEVLKFSEVDRITVITGPGYMFNDELGAFGRNYRDKVIILHNLNEREMRGAMLAADLAVLPSSGVLFEAIACKIPCVSGFYVENQRDIYQGFLNRNVFYDARDFTSHSLRSALRTALDSDPNQQIGLQAECIDGKSPQRFIQAFKNLVSK